MDKIEVNGITYYKNVSDYKRQIDKVISYLGDDMYNALKKARAFIAGGSVLSSFTNSDIHDIDVYFRDKESLVQAFLDVTVNWESIYLSHTDKSITLSDRDTGAIVQFIHFDYFKTPQDIFDCFDFTVCMACIDLSNDELMLDEEFISDMASRTLNFNIGTRYPYISLLRTKKYQEKGYKISRGQMLKIATTCSLTPIQNWDDAKSQLGGVYGDEIDAKLDSQTPFSIDRFIDILDGISDDIYPMKHQDYEELFFNLTGIEYSEYRRKKGIDF